MHFLIFLLIFTEQTPPDVAAEPRYRRSPLPDRRPRLGPGSGSRTRTNRAAPPHPLGCFWPLTIRAGEGLFLSSYLPIYFFIFSVEVPNVCIFFLEANTIYFYGRRLSGPSHNAGIIASKYAYLVNYEFG